MMEENRENLEMVMEPETIENPEPKETKELQDKKQKRSTGWQKTVATWMIVLGLAVMACFGTGMLIDAMEMNRTNTHIMIEDWVARKSYDDSDTLAGHIRQDMGQVLRHIGRKQALEDDGELDLEHTALVLQAKDGTITRYTMNQLVEQGISWGIDVYDTKEEPEYAYYYDGEESIGISVEKNIPVRILWSVTDPAKASVAVGEDVWEVRELQIQDAIQNAVDPAESGEEWTSLGYAVEYFCYYLQNYYYYERVLSEPGILSYRIQWIKNGTIKEYVDPHTEKNGQPLHPEAEWSLFYRYDSENRKIQSNIGGYVTKEPVSIVEHNNFYQADRVILSFGIKAGDWWPYQDAYAQEVKAYYTYGDAMERAVKVMGFCTMVVLVGMVWMVPWCGRKRNGQEICLNLYDRIPTELGAAGVLLLCAGGLVIGIYMEDVISWIIHQEVAVDVQNWILGGLLTTLLLLVYLILWLGLYGLIRRCKAHTLFRNCLCVMALRWVGKLMGWSWKLVKAMAGKIQGFWDMVMTHIGAVWKILLAVGAYAFVNCMLFRMCIWSWNHLLYLVLLIAFNSLICFVLIKKALQRKEIHQGISQIAQGHLDHQLPLDHLSGEEKKLGREINQICVGLKKAVEDSLKNERMKTELITNVSHDIKTPLTSIINYVDLLKRENIQDPKIQGYLQVLEQKSQRLKTLTEDLVEASKASSGTLQILQERIDFVELIRQTTGEFSDRFVEKQLQLVDSIPETPSYILADGRYVWRILENLYRNAEKYSMPGTRVYVEVFEKLGRVYFVMKNVSQAPLNIKAEELTERFIRGDGSRTTEGSGLGLSIAKDMAELMGGTFRIYLDGDLFRVTVSFALASTAKEAENMIQGTEESLAGGDQPLEHADRKRSWSDFRGMIKGFFRKNK